MERCCSMIHLEYYDEDAYYWHGFSIWWWRQVDVLVLWSTNSCSSNPLLVLVTTLLAHHFRSRCTCFWIHNPCYHLVVLRYIWSLIMFDYRVLSDRGTSSLSYLVGIIICRSSCGALRLLTSWQWLYHLSCYPRLSVLVSRRQTYCTGHSSGMVLYVFSAGDDLCSGTCRWWIRRSDRHQ
jgi:hypothetical protein